MIFIVVIIVIVLILSVEHFTDNSLNNVIDLINNEQIESKNINVSNEIKLNSINIKKVIMDIVYPVNSIYFSAYELDHNNKETCKGTPLEYGTWEEINRDEKNSSGGDEWSDFIFGLRRKNLGEAVYWGDYKIYIDKLPPHAHQVWHQMWYNSSDSGKGEESIGRWRKDDDFNGKEFEVDDNQVTKNIILDVKSNGKKISASKVNTGQDFHPRGYYAYAYKKTAL